MHARVLLIFLLAIGLQGCFSKPDFPNKPFIEFDKIIQVSIPDGTGGTMVDSLKIKIGYEDGNGDLGLNVSDTLSPFQLFEENGDNNPNYFNYHITIEHKVAGNYTPFLFPNNATLNGRFPRVLEGDKANPVAGKISFKVVPLLSEFPENDTIRFSIFILDRSLNKSNTIKTDSVIINRAF